MRKNCCSDREKLLKLKAEGQEFAKFLRSLEQFIQTVKFQNNFGKNIFQLVPEGFSYNINQNSNWKKKLQNIYGKVNHFNDFETPGGKL